MISSFIEWFLSRPKYERVLLVLDLLLLLAFLVSLDYFISLDVYGGGFK